MPEFVHVRIVVTLSTGNTTLEINWEFHLPHILVQDKIILLVLTK